MASAVFVARAFGVAAGTTPLVPKSVTVPGVVAIAGEITGPASLANAVGTLPGMVGATAATPRFKLPPIRDGRARGVAHGMAARGSDMAQAFQHAFQSDRLAGIFATRPWP